MLLRSASLLSASSIMKLKILSSLVIEPHYTGWFPFCQQGFLEVLGLYRRTDKFTGDSMVEWHQRQTSSVTILNTVFLTTVESSGTAAAIKSRGRKTEIHPQLVQARLSLTGSDGFLLSFFLASGDIKAVEHGPSTPVYRATVCFSGSPSSHF